MIPYGRQDISQDDIDRVVEVLRSDFLTQGPAIPRFEAAIATYCDAGHAVAVSNATAGLHIACLALGIGPGDVVWTSPNSFVASSNAAIYCGADVDFVDIDPKTYNMDINKLSMKLLDARESGRLPKVVIPVHHSGQSCDMAAIKKLSLEYDFSIIEDASHGIGGAYKGRQVGSCEYSDITVFSFHPVKIITTGEGGCVLTNDDDLAKRLRLYKSHGITSDPAEMYERPDNEIWNYQQVALGFNYRMTDIQAALGLSQLSRLDEFVTKRRQIAAVYDAEFSNHPVTTPWQHPDTDSSYHLYTIQIDEESCGATQRQAYEFLWKRGIAVNLHYIPIYLQPYYEKLGFKRGYCGNAETYYRRALSLPLFPSLQDGHQKQVVDAVKELVDQSR